MGKGLTIPLSLDPREWLRGIKVVERSLEDFEGSIEEVEDAGKKLGRKLEDVFDEAARDARQAGDKMERGLADGLDADSGNLRSVAGNLGGELADELAENWGEAVRSGDYASAFRETLSQLGQIGGALGGPAGAAIGAGAALALTVAFDTFMDTEGKERIKATTKALFDAANNAEDAYASGFEAAKAAREGYVAGFSEDEGLVTALGVDDLDAAWREVARRVEESGLPVETVTGAILGQRDAVDQVNGAIDGNQVAQKEVNAAMEQAVTDGAKPLYDQSVTTLGVLGDQETAMRDLLGYSEESITAQAEAAIALETQAYYAARTTENLKDAAAAGRGNADAATLAADEAARQARGLETARDRAASLAYWLDQASRIDVRVAGAGSAGGITT